MNHLNYYPKICICTIYMNISNSHSLYFRLCPLPFYSSFTRLLRKIDDWHSFNTYLFNRQVTKEHILVVTANQQKMNDVYRQLFYFLILKVLSKGRYKKYCMRQYFFWEHGYGFNMITTKDDFSIWPFLKLLGCQRFAEFRKLWKAKN